MKRTISISEAKRISFPRINSKNFPGADALSASALFFSSKDASGACEGEKRKALDF